MKSLQLLKALVALLLVLLLVYWVDLDELLLALESLTWELAGYLLLLSVLLIYISALKWQLFLGALGRHIRVELLFRLYVIGYFVNQLMPSFIGGDALRSWHVGRLVGQHEALAATVLERYTGFVAMVGIALASCWFLPSIGWPVRGGVVLATLILIFVTTLGLSENFMRLLERVTVFKVVVCHGRRVQASFRLVRNQPGLLAKAMGLSLLFHVFTVANTMAAAWAVGWGNPPIAELFVVLPLIMIIAALPITPSGLGLQEGAFMVFLQLLGASPAEALGVGVVLRVKAYFLGVVGGLLWLGLGKGEGILSPKPSANQRK